MINPDLGARALWEEPRSTPGGHYSITPNAQGAQGIRDAASKGRSPSWVTYTEQL